MIFRRRTTSNRTEGSCNSSCQGVLYRWPHLLVHIGLDPLLAELFTLVSQLKAIVDACGGNPYRPSAASVSLRRCSPEISPTDGVSFMGAGS